MLEGGGVDAFCIFGGGGGGRGRGWGGAGEHGPPPNTKKYLLCAHQIIHLCQSQQPLNSPLPFLLPHRIRHPTPPIFWVWIHPPRPTGTLPHDDNVAYGVVHSRGEEFLREGIAPGEEGDEP